MELISPELLLRLRMFAQEPGALFMAVSTQRGQVPIWAEDINKTRTDAELTALIQGCSGIGSQEEQEGKMRKIRS